MTLDMIDFEARRLNLFTKKRQKTITITLDSEIMFKLSEFVRKYKIQSGTIIGFTRQNAWNRINKYADLSHIKDLHPHKFRHGIAIYLLEQGVPIPVISARLGHANVYITMQTYLKVTPEIQRKMLQGIKWRDNLSERVE